MLLGLTVALVLAGLGLLLAGAVRDALGLIYLSILCTAIAGVALIVYVQVTRRRAVRLAGPEGGPVDPGAPGPGSGPEPLGSPEPDPVTGAEPDGPGEPNPMTGALGPGSGPAAPSGPGSSAPGPPAPSGPASSPGDETPPGS